MMPKITERVQPNKSQKKLFMRLSNYFKCNIDKSLLLKPHKVLTTNDLKIQRRESVK